MEEKITIITPSSAEEFDKLWQLNYEIFAAELKMRPESDSQRLVDKFHHKNIYRAAKLPSGEFAGMISAHWRSPYSAAAHFGDAIAQAPAQGKLAEIRLFALKPRYRSTTLASQLAVPLLLALEKEGVSEVIISGISDRKRFYEHLGFKVVGESITEGATTLYPMRGELPLILDRCRKALLRYR